MEGLDSLIQNKLLLQYLAGAGADISSGQGIGPNVNAVTQQNIQSQNMMKLLKQLLGPDGTKATFSNTGMNLTVPKESTIFGSILGGEGSRPFKVDPALDQNPVAPVTPTPTSSVRGGSFDTNPFVGGQSSLDFSASDLAGLTTQDISAALGMRMKRDSDLADVSYKQALTNQAIAATVENTPSIDVNIPGGGSMKLTPKDYITYRKIHDDNQPTKIKEYAFAKSPEGGSFQGSFEKFLSAGDTVGMKDFEEAKRTGYTGTSYYDYKIEMAKAGAPNLGAKAEEKKVLGAVEGQLDITKPGYARSVMNKTVDQAGWEFDNSTVIDDTVKRYPNLSRSQAVQALKMATVRSIMDGEIKQAYAGQVVEWKKDGWYIGRQRVVRDPYAK
jgi:hypothetical protein